MVITIEIDKHWTVGIDILRRVYGVRLGFIAVHVVLASLEDLEGRD
jgi:hypothetical protein